MKNTLPDFTNKVVSVSFVGADDSQAIQNPHWEMHGGRIFLVGTVPRGGSTRDWCKDVLAAAAWDKVSDCLVFDSVADYQSRLKIHESRKRKG